MNSMQCGGAEKSLIATLQTIDYDKYDVDLQLFENAGLFFGQIHPKVNILPEFEDFWFFDMPMKQAMIQSLSHLKLSIFINRIKFSLLSKNASVSSSKKEQIAWQWIKKTVRKNPTVYDAVIAGMEKTPTYYAVEFVKAKKKIAYVHLDYDKLEADPQFDAPYYDQLDHILTDSEGCKNILAEFFPKAKDKMAVVENIVSTTLINKLAKEPIKESFPEVFKIVSVGRLDHQKGYNLAIPALGIAKREGCKFHWVILGKGPDQEAFEALMEQEGIRENVSFLGIKENHYPYVAQADLFMQTSRFEGKSIAIDEAKILNKPILVTNFSTVKDQIEHNVTGYIAELNSESIADGFLKMYHDGLYRISLSDNLSRMELGTEYAIEKIYSFIN